jgi:hypothetical protein
MDVYFNDTECSNNMGWNVNLETCLNYIQAWNGSNYGYFADYKGGTVSVCTANGNTVFETAVI